jgi:putative peptide zinc metalloprotease protein
MPDPTQTFSESWYRIAGQKLSLRPNIIVQRQNFRGERWIVLQNPFSNQFFRLRPAAYEFVARLRRDRTVQEVWQECLEKFPDEAPGQEAVIQLLSQLYFANLLQYEAAGDTAQLFQRYTKTRQRETRARLMNVMFMRFPLLDPDRFLVRTLPIARALINPIGALIWLVVVGYALKLVLDNWGALREQSQAVLAPNNLFLLYAGLVIIKTLHEFGHAYFCRRYGGEVHVMGIMLMIFTPIPYMDATSSWSFRSRWKRLLVGGAGMIVELFVAALATFVWANTGPGTLHSLAYNMMFVASVSTIIFNINPLLRYDGYYILSDLLEIPNLYQKSLQQLKHLFERYMFGVEKSESPTRFKREKAWLTAYGISSNIYRIIIFSGIMLFVADRFLLLGILMAVICGISWIIAPIFKLLKYLATSPSLDRNRWRAVTSSAAVFAGLVILLDVVPFPSHFRAPGMIRSREWTEVANEVSGRLEAVIAPSGARVSKGQVLLELKNEPLQFELAAAIAGREEIQARLRHARHQQIANLKPLLSRLEVVEKRVQRLERDRDSLQIQASQDGIWVAPQINEWKGRWLLRGTALGLVLDPSAYEFTAVVAQDDGDSLFSRKIFKAEARLHGQSDRVLSLGELDIIPAEQRQLPSAALGWMAGGEVPVSPSDPHGLRAMEPFFEVRAPVLDGEEAALLHGRAGKIRFKLESEPLWPRWMRRLRQLLQKRYQL